MAIAENVAYLRNAQGLSQRDLAEAVGISGAMVAQIERGTKTLSLPLAERFAKELHCEITDFLRPAPLRPAGMKN